MKSLKSNPIFLAAICLFMTGCVTNVTLREQGFEDLRNDDYASAVEDFQAAVDKKPSDYQSQYYLGLSYLRLDEPIKAQTPLEQALALRPEDPQWTPKIADALAESYLNQGRTETLYGFLDSMVQANGQQTRDFLRQAEFLGRAGDADGQKLALQKAAYFAPMGDAEPYLKIADFYQEVDDFDNTVQALKYAYYVNPELEETKDRLRGLGIVPGPTISDAPPKPEIMQEPAEDE
jgi:tetratricopeptide (TPR) repeat protein